MALEFLLIGHFSLKFKGPRRKLNFKTGGGVRIASIHHGCVLHLKLIVVWPLNQVLHSLSKVNNCLLITSQVIDLWHDREPCRERGPLNTCTAGLNKTSCQLAMGSNFFIMASSLYPYLANLVLEPLPVYIAYNKLMLLWHFLCI